MGGGGEGFCFPACITGHMPSIRGVCLRGGGGLHPGGSAYGGGGLGKPPPPELEKRAVGILLEYFLVSDICLHMGTEVGRGVVPDQSLNAGHFSSGYFEKL